ncbi:MAG: hypothetical protein HY647_06590 [Acidobacteria bacterium]|nr:hypothetical protein [Acidobacteriota bacterium]
MKARFSVSILRWLVLAGIAAVVGVTVASYSIQRGKREPARPLPPKISADVEQQTQVFSLSKTLGKDTLYTVQAEQVTNFKDTGKAVLRNVSIVLHGSEGQRHARIATPECEYDPASGLLVSSGEVQMEFQISLPGATAQSNASAPTPISISTTGLSFEQNTGIASTRQPVRFRFPQGEGRSRGASYNPQTEWLVLPSDVQFTLVEGSPQPKKSAAASPLTHEGSPAPGQAGPQSATTTYIQAAQLRFHRRERRLLLGAPVQIVQASRKLLAGDSEIVLNERHQARLIRLSGGITGSVSGSAATSELHAKTGWLELSEGGKVQRIHLEQDVQWLSSTPSSYKEGRAERAEIFFSEPAGLLERIQANGSVRVVLRHPPASNSTPRLPAGRKGTIAAVESEILSAQKAEIFFASDGETLQRVLTDSASTLQLLAPQRAEDRWNIQASRFEMDFGPEGRLDSFRAEGNVKWSAESSNTGARIRSSTSHSLAAFFDPSTHLLNRLQQQGSFDYKDADKQARAETAEYRIDKEEVHLRGQPVVWNASGKITAQEIVLDDSQKRLTARGDVATAYFPQVSPGNPPAEPVHGVADRLEYDLVAQRAQYEGRSRLWQGQNLLEARSIEMDGQRKELVARQGVYSVWSGLTATTNQQRSASPKASGAPAVLADAYEIRSGFLVYRDQPKIAHYQGDVSMTTNARTLTASELDLFFRSGVAAAPEPTEAGGMQLERAMAKGQVRLVEPHRIAEGTQAEYLPELGQILLLGSPATIRDSQRGTLQGARLTYSIEDGRILVDGEPGVPAQTQWQVRR